jgi:WD40 repeat protein
MRRRHAGDDPSRHNHINQLHSDWVQSVALSPDDQAALSGSGDRTLKLWEVATGKLLRTLRGHSDEVLRRRGPHHRENRQLYHFPGMQWGQKAGHKHGFVYSTKQSASTPRAT